LKTSDIQPRIQAQQPTQSTDFNDYFDLPNRNRRTSAHG
jgi:hypothetical protein